LGDDVMIPFGPSDRVDAGMELNPAATVFGVHENKRSHKRERP
jgi:hypothetical protein